MLIQAGIFVFWALPVLVAWSRNVRWRTFASIVIVTATLSWTCVGWIAALVWSLEAPRGN